MAVFATYILRIAALLLRTKDLDDHIGLSHPFALASLAILVSEPQKIFGAARKAPSPVASTKVVL